MEDLLSLSPMRAVLACVILASATPGLAADADNRLECGDRSALVALVSQSGLYLNRSPHKSSKTGSILKSLAFTALTAGTFLVMAGDTGDAGATLMAPESTNPELQPQTFAAMLTTALAAEFPEMNVLPSQTDHKAIDGLMTDQHCTKGLAVSTEYRLELQKRSVYLNLYTRLYRLGRDNDKPWQINIAEVEYHSVSLPFNVDSKQKSGAAALGKWIEDARPTLQASLHEGILETVSLSRFASLEKEERPAAEPIGKFVKSVACEDCAAADRLAKQFAIRVWLQPANRYDLWRSLPVKP